MVRELALRLHRLGTNVEVACLAKWGPVADQLRDAGIAVTALNARGATDLKILPRLIRLIRDRQFTTVMSFLTHANAMAAAASLRCGGVRWIQSIQTTQPWPGWHWKVQKLAQHRAEKIVVPSPSVARCAAEWAGIRPHKLLVIPNAIDLADWTDAQSHIPASDPRPYPITFLGRLDPIKDVPTLIEAVAQLSPSVHLHVYGDGSDRHRIEASVARFHAPVTLHGSVVKPQIALRESGLLVLPSLAEGFGLVLIEAMAAGVPVVATDVPGIRDVVQNEQTGLLVPPSNPTALASAIRRVIEDRPLRERVVRNGSVQVRERFSWDAVLPQYLQLLGKQRT